MPAHRGPAKRLGAFLFELSRVAAPSLATRGYSVTEMVRELEQEMMAQGASDPPESGPPEESGNDALARLVEGVQRIEEAESSRHEGL